MKTKLGLLATSALAALALVGCGDTSTSASSNSSAYEEVPVVAVKNKTISGSAQKGPFVNGASVTVQELDGKTLAQTGKSFKGKISGDKGEFTVSSVTLASQYALLEATGYYMNENTGAKSNGTITLNALVDLSKRENVNINLLTHLEYERALYLTTTGMNVTAAKKQAEKEIFEAFGITGNFASSEELNILSTSEGDAALLAISVLMQSDLTEAELSERLANFASDIEEDGKWDDETTKAAMADWASSTNLADVGANVKAMNANGKAPAFEQAVKNFWWNVYGLGSCGNDNGGEIKLVDNANSRNNESSYVCDDENWRPMTKIEKIVGKGCTSYNLSEEKLVAGYYECDSSGVWAAGRTVSGTLSDTRDGNRQYATIGIGTQMWMAENLNYDYKVAGESYGSNCKNNSADSCAKYGKLYTWGAAMDSATTGCGYPKQCNADTGKVQGVCPNGWHLPSQAEWQTLFTAVGGLSTAGTALKTNSGWYNNYNGTDAFGFSALQSGLGSQGGFVYNTCGAAFWSSSEYGAEHAWITSLYCSYTYASLDDVSKFLGFAVRCVKD